jgi:hypothetical protein
MVRGAGIWFWEAGRRRLKASVAARLRIDRLP